MKNFFNGKFRGRKWKLNIYVIDKERIGKVIIYYFVYFLFYIEVKNKKKIIIFFLF